MSFMHRPSRLTAVVFLLGAGLLSQGCGGSHSWGGGSHADGGIKEGVAYNFVIDALTCDGRVFLVATVDGCSASSVHTSPTSRGVWRTVDGRSLEWSCTTADGTGGTVAIAGQQFDLAKGGIFLVTAKANQTKVEQLALDMSKLRGDSVVRLLEDDFGKSEAGPRIQAFLKGCRGEK
jgi:hypothetical protein